MRRAAKRLALHAHQLKAPYAVMEAMKAEGFSPFEVREAIEEMEYEESVDPMLAQALREQLAHSSADVPRKNPPVPVTNEGRGVVFKRLNKNLGVARAGRKSPTAVKVRCPVTGFLTVKCSVCALYGGMDKGAVRCTARKGATYSMVADGPMPVAPADRWDAYVASQQTVKDGGRRFITLRAKDGD